MPPRYGSVEVKMKEKTKNIKNKMKNENGMVIVEAAIVFPVVFFVLLFIIFIGNMYYEQAKVDRIVLTYANKGAQYVADPSLYDMDHGGSVPSTVNDLDIEPYRYIIGSISNGSVSAIENVLSEQVKNEINRGGLVLFSNGKTNVIGSDNSKIATFKNYVVYSTFVVQVNYEVKFPIRFFGEANPTIARLSSRAEVAVNDAPEFIRNVDMVVDLLDGTKTAESVNSIFSKINEFIKKFTAR